jgi:hypothetical protein
MIGKKYILFMLCLFCTKQIHSSYFSKEKIGFAIGAIGVVLYIMAKSWVKNKINHKISVFQKEENHEKMSEWLRILHKYTGSDNIDSRVLKRIFSYLFSSYPFNALAYSYAENQIRQGNAENLLLILAYKLNLEKSYSYYGRKLYLPCLTIACNEKNHDLVKILLDYQANPDISYWKPSIKIAPHHYRETHQPAPPTILSDRPLHITTHNNDLESVKLLTKHNTRTHPFLDTVENNSPINFALNHKNFEMFNHLLCYTLSRNLSRDALYPILVITKLGLIYDIDHRIKNIYCSVICNKADLASLKLALGNRGNFWLKKEEQSNYEKKITINNQEHLNTLWQKINNPEFIQQYLATTQITR